MADKDKKFSKIYIELDWEKIYDRPNDLSDEEVGLAVNQYYELFVEITMDRYGVTEEEALEILEGTPLKKALQEFGYLQMRADPESELDDLEKYGWIKKKRKE